MKRTLSIGIIFLLLQSCGPRIETEENYQPLFAFENSYVYPGNPEFVYDYLTGDISDWWDHSFSENPLKIFIEAKPGGGFYEIFDESGDGVLHATVIAAQRGKLLRMDGPLGLAGQALTLVCTYQLKPQGKDSTMVVLSVRGAGEIQKGIPEIVESVWDHFLGEQFSPYITQKFNEAKTMNQ